MAYVRRHWVDYPDTSTPIDADALNNIEDGIEESHNIQLLAVTDTAPSECVEGDKYYDTTTKLIYTATGTNEWGETGETPIADIFYFVLDEQTGYTYNGSTLVSIGGESMPSILSTIYPVGSIYMSVNSANPSTLFGGTWVAWGTGRVPVGVDTSQTEFNTVEKTGGSKFLQEHKHTYSIRNTTVPSAVQLADPYYVSGTNWTGSSTWETKSAGTGDSGNLQPYITCYMWKRTA